MTSPWKHTLPCLLAGAVLSTTAMAGSDRWIMAITPEHAAQQDLVHLYFITGNGTRIESDSLKKMVIDNQGCKAEKPYEVVINYKLGYGPNRGAVGIYLLPAAWHDQAVCFSVPGIGRVEQRFDATASGKSMELTLLP